MDRQADPVAELPSGTLTLVFTDIEGSTRLLTRLGDDYARVLADHRRLLRAAFAAHGARELGTEGDSCFVAFARARDAVAAVSDAQRALAAHAWPQGAEVRVRGGMPWSEPAVGPESLVGLGVHRAARICAAAHGGQVLLSGTTRELLQALPSRVGVLDLGEHRLRDLDRPEHLFQLVVADLPRAFAPLKALRRGSEPPLP